MKRKLSYRNPLIILLIIFEVSISLAQTYESGINVSTLSGSSQGYLDGLGTSARFDTPAGIAIDVTGNMYVTDLNNHKIRKITPTGLVSTLAGSTAGFLDATGTASKFNYPHGIAVDASGNVYVADSNNNRIRKITPAGVVSTLAGSGAAGFSDGIGTAAKFDFPTGVSVDVNGNVYVVDKNNHKIRKITPAGDVSTFAGSTQGYLDAAGTSARFNYPYGITLDASNNIFISDSQNHKIRKITPLGLVSTLAGSTSGFADGTTLTSKFSFPQGLAIDDSNNLFVADNNNHKIRKISQTGLVSTVAGSVFGYQEGSGNLAKFYYPHGIVIDTASGNMYVTDYYNHKIRKIEGAVLGLETNNSSQDFVVYPNPSNGIYNFEIQNNATVYVYNLIGTEILNQKVVSGNSTINLEKFPKGVYFLKIVSEKNQTKKIKLIKE